METKSSEPKNITIESYKGVSPSWMAVSSAAAYTVFALPFMWVANGLVNLVSDRLFNKIPFKQDAWKRFKSIEAISATVLGGFLAWDVYKKAKEAFVEAKEAEHQFNKLSLEHGLYREQLLEAGIKPKDTKFVREVDMQALNIQDKPSASHAEKIAAKKAATVDATPEL